MIYRDFCAKVYTFNNFKIFLLLEVLIKEKKFSCNDECIIANVLITPVAILPIKTTKGPTQLLQVNQSRLLQSELKELFEEEIYQLIND